MPNRITLDLATVTGGPAAIMAAFLADPQVRRTPNMATPVAMTVCRGIAEQLALKNMRDTIEPLVQDTYDMYVLTNGAYEDCADTAARDEWTAGIDDVIERLLEPYERCVSANWFGVNVIDTRLHQAVKPGEDSEVAKLAKGFAKDAWRVLIHDMEHDPDDEGPPVLSTAKILSAVGIVASDLKAAMAELPPLTAAELQQEEQANMSTLQDALEKIHTHLGGNIDPSAVEPLLDNAIDDDDGIALSGIQALGGELDDCEPLRMFAMEHGDGAAEALVDFLMEGPPDFGIEVDAMADQTDNEAAELAALMGGAVEGTPAQGTFTIPGLQVHSPNANDSMPPKPATRPGKGDVLGAIPAEAFAIMRSHINLKDDEIALVIGVSRQTFINYGKKSTFVPSTEQKQALLNLIAEHRGKLDRAYELVAGV